jgi:hypothetical protein
VTPAAGVERSTSITRAPRRAAWYATDAPTIPAPTTSTSVTAPSSLPGPVAGRGRRLGTSSDGDDSAPARRRSGTAAHSPPCAPPAPRSRARAGRPQRAGRVRSGPRTERAHGCTQPDRGPPAHAHGPRAGGGSGPVVCERVRAPRARTAAHSPPADHRPTLTGPAPGGRSGPVVCERVRRARDPGPQRGSSRTDAPQPAGLGAASRGRPPRGLPLLPPTGRSRPEFGRTLATTGRRRYGPDRT